MSRSASRSWLLAAVVVVATTIVPLVASRAYAAGHPSLTVTGAGVREGDAGRTDLVFTVRLAHATGARVTVGYATASGTASAGSDFVRTTGTLTFRGRTVVRHVSVPVVGDRRVEPTEWFRLVLGPAHGAAIAVRSARGTITNDDERLTVVPSGLGAGTVSSDPAGISCPGTCSVVLPLGAVVSLGQSAGSGSVFSGWSGDCTGAGDCAVTMSASRSVGAGFDLLPLESLSVVGPVGGTVTSNDAMISCGVVCQASYPRGTPVSLTATADDGWQFGGWLDQDGGADCVGATTTCDLDLESDDTVTAQFLRLITITVAGPGKVYLGAQQVCPDALGSTICQVAAPPTDSRTFSAISDPTGVFGQWAGSCGATSTGATCVVDPGGPAYLSAIFNMKPPPGP